MGGAAEGSGPYLGNYAKEAITPGGLRAVIGDYATEAFTRGG
jgi:hypothetical protein